MGYRVRYILDAMLAVPGVTSWLQALGFPSVMWRGHCVPSCIVSNSYGGHLEGQCSIYVNSLCALEEVRGHIRHLDQNYTLQSWFLGIWKFLLRSPWERGIYSTA